MSRLERKLKKYGETALIGETSFNCIIYPINYKSKINTEGEFTPIGFESDATYIMYAPEHIGLKNLPHGTVVKADSGNYMIYHSDNFCLFGKPFYCYAYMKRSSEDE